MKNRKNIIAIVVLIAVAYIVYKQFQPKPSDYYSQGSLVSGYDPMA